MDILNKVIKMAPIIGVMVAVCSIVGYITYKAISIDIHVTNHIPTQITEVNNRIDRLETKIDNNQKEINQRFDKLYQILLDKK